MSRPIRTVYLIYAAAAGYLLLLLSFLQKDVFFSGDGGLKFMMVRQICAGEDFRYIAHTQPAWVNEIWAMGYFPLKHPFVFDSPKGYLFVFPPPFQIVNAFFYGRFGYRGLYIIPSLCLLLAWYWFIRLAGKMQFSAGQVSLMFFLLAFCSPLTLYGAIYWEHTASILLLFAGVVMIVHPPRRPWQALVLGCLSGMATWVREEALLLNIFFAGALLVVHFRSIRSSHVLFALGLFLGTGSFLLFNKLEYGYFFGIHGYQLLGDAENIGNYRRYLRNIYNMNVLLVSYFPLILLLLPVLFARFRLKWPLAGWTEALLVVTLLFWSFAPFLFPNDGGKQWGPRFLLPLIPMSLLILAQAHREWKALMTVRFRRLLAVLVLLAGGYSFVLNTGIGAWVLRDDGLNRVRPALNFIKESPGDVVVVNSDFIPQEMSSIFREKYFFLAEDTASIHRLITLLAARGVDRFVYIDGEPTPAGIRELLAGYHATLDWRGGYLVSAVDLGPSRRPAK